LSNSVNRMANKKRNMLRDVVEKGFFRLDGDNYTVFKLPGGNNMNHSIRINSEPFTEIDAHHGMTGE